MISLIRRPKGKSFLCIGLVLFRWDMPIIRTIKYNSPLLIAKTWVLFCNHPVSLYQHYLQPISIRPYFQNNFSSTNAMTSDHQHPRCLVWNWNLINKKSAMACTAVMPGHGYHSKYMKILLSVFQSFNVEAKCWWNLINVFTIKLLQYCCLACII